MLFENNNNIKRELKFNLSRLKQLSFAISRFYVFIYIFSFIFMLTLIACRSKHLRKQFIFFFVLLNCIIKKIRVR